MKFFIFFSVLETNRIESSKT